MDGIWISWVCDVIYSSTIKAFLAGIGRAVGRWESHWVGLNIEEGIIWDVSFIMQALVQDYRINLL